MILKKKKKNPSKLGLFYECVNISLSYSNSTRSALFYRNEIKFWNEGDWGAGYTLIELKANRRLLEKKKKKIDKVNCYYSVLRSRFAFPLELTFPNKWVANQKLVVRNFISIITYLIQVAPYVGGLGADQRNWVTYN